MRETDKRSEPLPDLSDIEKNHSSITTVVLLHLVASLYVLQFQVRILWRHLLGKLRARQYRTERELQLHLVVGKI